jgi:hypothetical protein
VKEFVNEGGLAVVNVGDDGHVPDLALLHCCACCSWKKEKGRISAPGLAQKRRNVPQAERKDKEIGREPRFSPHGRTGLRSFPASSADAVIKGAGSSFENAKGSAVALSAAA